MPIRAQERKLLEVVDVLEEARHLLSTAVASTRDSSQALRRQAAQAQRRTHELLSETARLISTTERLLAEARSIQGEQV